MHSKGTRHVIDIQKKQKRQKEAKRGILKTGSPEPLYTPCHIFHLGGFILSQYYMYIVIFLYYLYYLIFESGKNYLPTYLQPTGKWRSLLQWDHREATQIDHYDEYHPYYTRQHHCDSYEFSLKTEIVTF